MIKKVSFPQTLPIRPLGNPRATWTVGELGIKAVTLNGVLLTFEMSDGTRSTIWPLPGTVIDYEQDQAPPKALSEGNVSGPASSETPDGPPAAPSRKPGR